MQNWTRTAGALALAVTASATTVATANAVTGAPGDERGPAARCARDLNQAVAQYISTTGARDARGFERLLATDYTVVLPGGTTFAGKPAGAAFIDRFFARTDWTQTFAVTRTTVEGCSAAAVLLDSTYTDADGPVDLVVGLSWVHEDGHWRVLLDQNTVIS